MTQQKTKRIVPKCREDWEKAVKLYVVGEECKDFKVMLSSMVACGVYKTDYLVNTFSIPYAAKDAYGFSLEIPVTTKRIPFDASRKDAKVFVKDAKTIELTDWHQMKNGRVVGTYTLSGLSDDGTDIFSPEDLEMEIEE